MIPTLMKRQMSLEYYIQAWQISKHMCYLPAFFCWYCETLLFVVGILLVELLLICALVSLSFPCRIWFKRLSTFWGFVFLGFVLWVSVPDNVSDSTSFEEDFDPMELFLDDVDEELIWGKSWADLVFSVAREFSFCGCSMFKVLQKSRHFFKRQKKRKGQEQIRNKIQCMFTVNSEKWLNTNWFYFTCLKDVVVLVSTFVSLGRNCLIWLFDY